MAALGAPSFSLLLPAQALGSFAEMFGQREVRVVHNHSIVRALLAITVYSAIEVYIDVFPRSFGNHIFEGGSFARALPVVIADRSHRQSGMLQRLNLLFIIIESY